MPRKWFVALTLAPILAIVALIATNGSDGPRSAEGIIIPTPPPFGVAVVVNTHSDLEDPGDGTCSLRAAIEATNTNSQVGNCDASASQAGGTDGIGFDIPPGGIQTISPTSALPAITGALSIDGGSQPPASDACGAGLRPCIIIDGTSAAGFVTGLTIKSSNVSIRGLAVVNFPQGGGIVTTAGSADNVNILGNYLGTADGVTAAPNFGGIDVFAGHATIGGTTAADRNVISGNDGAGVELHNGDATVKGNYIGTNASGDASLGNGIGVDVYGSQNNTIGGPAASEGNLISGNIDAGIVLFGGMGDVVQGNLVGTDATGANAIENHYGISISDSSGETIGGDGPGERNIVAGNHTGMFVFGATTTSIVGNYIGLNAAGAALGNGVGVDIQPSQQAAPADANQVLDNVISANEDYGLRLESIVYGGDVTNTVVNGNFIGANPNGTASIPNRLGGILLSTVGSTGHVTNNQIGNDAAHPNVISGNGGDGIDLTGAQTTSNTIFVNLIGTNENSDSGLGNAGDGVHIVDASGNTIGSVTAPTSAGSAQPESASAGGNVIWNNGSAGVHVEGATAVGNAISGNSIFKNGGLGIELVTGGNASQPAPVLTSAQKIGDLHITGSLISTANATFSVEFFLNPSCDSSGSGEGQDFLGSLNVIANGSGLGTIDTTLPTNGAQGNRVTATATNAGGNTSAFSNCELVSGPTPIPTPSPSPTATPTPSQTSTPTLTPTATPVGQTPSPTPTLTLIWGDGDCSGAVSPVDSLKTLKTDAGLAPTQTVEGCPAWGSNVTVNGITVRWGDVDCSGSVSPIDSLKVLKTDAGFPPTQTVANCPAMGSTVQVS